MAAHIVPAIGTFRKDKIATTSFHILVKMLLKERANRVIFFFFSLTFRFKKN